MLTIGAAPWRKPMRPLDVTKRGGSRLSVRWFSWRIPSARRSWRKKMNWMSDCILTLPTNSRTNQSLEPLEIIMSEIVRFLTGNKYSQLLYNPFLRKEFAYSYEAQAEEFARLYSKPPSHIDGHHHMHLCANFLLSNMIPAGTKMRRNFSFWPGEKSLLNRAYRVAGRSLACSSILSSGLFLRPDSVH